MIGTRRVQDKQHTSPKGGLLALRVLNALPYSSSVKDLYTRTKQSNEIFKVGLDLAESCAVAVSSPFINKYAAIDRFAALQLEKIEDKYGVDLVAKSVGAVAYPIGYSLGLAGFARNKVTGLAAPVVDYTYEVADVVIDQLLPPDYDESMEEEYRKISHLQHKNPIDLLKERTTIGSLIRLPSTTFLLSMNLFTSTLYLCTGFASMSMGRMITSASNLINSINTQFEADLKHPWTVMNSGDLTKLSKLIIFNGIKSFNESLSELENQILDLSRYLDDRNLPHNSQVLKYVASKLKSIERRLIRLGGVRLVATSQKTTRPAPSKTPTRRTVRPQLRFTPRSSPAKLRSSPDRVPTIMLGEEQQSWIERSQHEWDEHKHEIEEHAHHEELLHHHKAELLEERAPTMMWVPTEEPGESSSSKSKALIAAPSKELAVVPSKEVVVSKAPTPKKAIPRHLGLSRAAVAKKAALENKPNKEAAKSKPVAKHPQIIKEIAKPKEVRNENAKPIEKEAPRSIEKEVAKPAEHKSTEKEITQSLFKKGKIPKARLAKKIVWPKEDSSAFVKLAEENKKKEELRKAEELAAASKKDEAPRHEEFVEKEVDPNVDEHGFTLVKPPANGHLIPQDIAKDLFTETKARRSRKHLTPVTPANSPAEALSNNPFGDILVEEEEVLRGPEVLDAHQAKIRDQELMAHQRSLQKQTLHELLQQVGDRLAREERRAEENAEAGPWQTVKNPAHVHAEEPAAKPSADVASAPENNPFAKLPAETTEDPLSMGLSTM
eukprot:Phypoly_transcript_03242.p1 GENE.Phypoly_transcript_03242~~Phypoly_transcript_03242.p1  ORF type:complete len:777 (+),score=180.05 Phypoly_transcript_03242:72-2402(+)